MKGRYEVRPDSMRIESRVELDRKVKLDKNEIKVRIYRMMITYIRLGKHKVRSLETNRLAIKTRQCELVPCDPFEVVHSSRLFHPSVNCPCQPSLLFPIPSFACIHIAHLLTNWSVC